MPYNEQSAEDSRRLLFINLSHRETFDELVGQEVAEHSASQIRSKIIEELHSAPFLFVCCHGCAASGKSGFLKSLAPRLSVKRESVGGIDFAIKALKNRSTLDEYDDEGKENALLNGYIRSLRSTIEGLSRDQRKDILSNLRRQRRDSVEYYYSIHADSQNPIYLEADRAPSRSVVQTLMRWAFGGRSGSVRTVSDFDRSPWLGFLRSPADSPLARWFIRALDCLLRLVAAPQHRLGGCGIS